MKNLSTRWFLVLVSVMAMLSIGMSQTAEERAKKSDEILEKVKRVDLLNQILPLLLTKDQIKKILPALEKARQAVVDTNAKEFAELKKLEPKLDLALKDAKEGKTPTREVLIEIASVFKGLEMYRKLVSENNTRDVLAAFTAATNEGQRKAAANSLRLELIDPSLDPKKMTEEEKLKTFVKIILLEPSAYNVLRDLSK